MGDVAAVPFDLGGAAGCAGARPEQIRLNASVRVVTLDQQFN
jgi:hypothetical protein